MIVCGPLILQLLRPQFHLNVVACVLISQIL